MSMLDNLEYIKINGIRKFVKKETSRWKCSKCGMEFAGGAYVPQTDVGKVALRSVQAGVNSEDAVVEFDKAGAKEEN